MCLPFCMCSTVKDDYDPAPAGRTTQLPAQRNGGSHYNGNGYSAQHAPAAAANDVSRGPAHAVPAGAGAQEKADWTLKQPAGRNGMVAAADGARGVAHNYYYNGREQPAHREDAAAAAAAAASDFYHHHPAATATAGHERY